jgi:hypothetical protein
MRSMHLTAGSLCARAIWGQDHWYRLWGLALSLVMLVGSVHIGWRYAVDSYVRIVCALILWWLTGRVVVDP